VNAPSLLVLFPEPKHLLELATEDLGGAIFEVLPSLMQRDEKFSVASLTDQLFRPYGPSYPHGSQRQLSLALAEAMGCLLAQGLIVADPDQMGSWYVPTRRADGLRNRSDVKTFLEGRILPDDLLPPFFARKVVPLFRRGDHDVAVFQAFKEVEVAVRNAANAKGAGYADDEVGTKLMRKAFHPDNGPLSDMTVVFPEREAVMFLFSGAIGHAKNPTSHRDVMISAPEAARLIIFASHLFDIVGQRLF
jgi:Protein of unknown function (Hypoth_ymh)